MNNLRPGAIALLAGGALLFISTFLNWGGDQSGISLKARGLQGLICLVIGGGVVLVVTLANFANNSLSLNVAGLDTNGVLLTLGIAAFLMNFGLQFADESQVGVLLGWIGAAAIVVGAVLEERETGTGSTPPTPF